MKRTALFALLAGSAALLISAACSSSPPVSGGPAPAPTSSETGCPDAAAPNVEPSGPVSFRDGVMPIFARSCSFESCHGIYRPDRVRLGSVPDAGTDGPTPATIRAALLERSNRSDLVLVQPSKPNESFLMLKLDGDLCGIESRCPDGCGESMPKTGNLLDPEKRETIRRWIAAGALDD